MTPRARVRPAGFTLIELLITVAIIGLLASAAIPNYLRLTYRARAAERSLMIDAIARGVTDVVAAPQAFPDASSPNVWIGVPNPAGVATAQRRRFDYSLAGWGSLPVVVEGGLFYTYTFVALFPAPAPPTLSVVAIGDLDGDGNPSWKTVNFLSRSWSFYKDPAPGGEVPAPGQEDPVTF